MYITINYDLLISFKQKSGDINFNKNLKNTLAMLDQSFSAKNFSKIYEDENRKGVDLASRFIPPVQLINSQLKVLREKLKKRNRLNKDEKAEVRLGIQQLEANKEINLALYFEELEFKVLENSKLGYLINLEKNTSLTSKPLYLIKKNDDVSYFIIKIIQRNIRKLYKVKQSDRHHIVSQLSTLLDNDFPKHLIRTDIKEFYESINHQRLFELIDHENLLSFNSKQYIKSIIQNYTSLSLSDRGVPRGVGISAYLSELFMREFDRKIKFDSDITYYARYVDDISIIYAPSPNLDLRVKRQQITKIAKSFDLKINSLKTKVFDQTKEKFKFDYLGYEFCYENKKLFLDLSSRKFQKYKLRIDKCFESYFSTPSNKQTLAGNLLKARIKFLTSNTKLVGNKNGTLIGVYFSNKLIKPNQSSSKKEKILQLDSYLQKRITELNSGKIKNELKPLKFKEGFDKKRFYKFSTQDIKKIVRIWG
jgi:hypothetical protein